MNLTRIKVCLHPLKFRRYQFLYPFIVLKRQIGYFGKWEMPEGYDTKIMVYNSAVNKKVPLILKRKGLATWYMCGPTVYAESHIGHASCYIKFDIIRRVLENFFNINVMLLLGITDIDDKIIKKSNETGVSAFHLAKKYELEFLKDMEIMKVLLPTAMSRVSENIPLIISFCEKLIETEFAYATNEGNVYFMVSKSVTADVLNEMSNGSSSEIQTDPLKKDPRDFALWKAAKPNEPFWESPWGKGRPGWHIECSVMASKIFGSQLDLHSGGYDLLFPHHTNEKSQSEAYHGCSQWVNYWLHAGLLNIGEDVKMSKSLGNTISIKDFLKDHFVNDFRILCLQSLYRKNLSYNSETLSGAKSLHRKLHNFISECELYISGEIKGNIADGDKLLTKLANTKEQIISFLGNDFNTSQVLLCLTDFIDEINKSLPAANATESVTTDSISTIATCCFYVDKILEVLGISILSKKKLPKHLLYAVDATVEFRNKIRLFALNPKDTGKDENSTYYVDKAYKSLMMKLDIVQNSKKIPKYIAEISETSRIIYEKVYQFAEVLDKETTLNSLNPKEAKKKMAALFTICDEFRSCLLQQGISIKDKGNGSVWIPLIELQKACDNS